MLQATPTAHSYHVFQPDALMAPAASLVFADGRPAKHTLTGLSQKSLYSASRPKKATPAAKNNIYIRAFLLGKKH